MSKSAKATANKALNRVLAANKKKEKKAADRAEVGRIKAKTAAEKKRGQTLDKKGK